MRHKPFDAFMFYTQLTLQEELQELKAHNLTSEELTAWLEMIAKTIFGAKG